MRGILRASQRDRAPRAADIFKRHVIGDNVGLEPLADHGRGGLPRENQKTFAVGHDEAVGENLSFLVEPQSVSAVSFANRTQIVRKLALEEHKRILTSYIQGSGRFVAKKANESFKIIKSLIAAVKSFMKIVGRFC
ncbi:MAG: hypothetical protein NVV63_03565 [Opitutus sp.]|nr:hypothetical protein [Opitutus sp.]